MSDYIKRSDALKLLREEINLDVFMRRGVPNAMKSLGKICEGLEAITPADVRPVVRGEWVKNKDRVGWHCSVCKVDNIYAYSWNSEKGKDEFQDNYCPCCGADMRGGFGE